MFRQRHVAPILLGTAVCFLPGLTGTPALSQPASAEKEPITLLREALIGPAETYVALPAAVVWMSGASGIGSSPGGEDAVFSSTRYSLPRSIDRSLDALLTDKRVKRLEVLNSGASYETQMLLLSQGSDRAQVIWRGGGSMAAGVTEVKRIHWLPGTRWVALHITSVPGPLPDNYFGLGQRGQPGQTPPTTTSVVLINGATGKAERVASDLPASTQIVTSFLDPVVVILDPENGTMQRIESGKVGPLHRFSTSPDKESPIRWHTALYGDRLMAGERSEPNDDGTGEHVAYYQFDTVTGEMSRLDKPAARGLVTIPAADRPFVVRREKTVVESDGRKKEIYPLWLEARDKATAGRILIAADSDPEKEPVILQSAVLHEFKGAVYAVPILKLPSSAFLARQKEAMKAETLNRAQSIREALSIYLSRQGAALVPPVGSDIPALFTPILKDKSIFENPATGKQGFTALYQEVTVPPFDREGSKPFGSLDGPGGKAIIYFNGPIKWQDAPGPPSKP